MQLNDFENYGIRGNEVNGFRLTYSLIGGVNGTNVATPFNDGSVSFIGTPTHGFGLSGSVAILDNEITGGRQRNVSIDNATGTMNLNFLRNNVHHTQPLAERRRRLRDRGRHQRGDVREHLEQHVHRARRRSLQPVAGQQRERRSDLQRTTTCRAASPAASARACSSSARVTTARSSTTSTGNDVQGNVQGAAIFVNKGSGTGNVQRPDHEQRRRRSRQSTGSGSAQAMGIHASARGAGGSHTHTDRQQPGRPVLRPRHRARGRRRQPDIRWRR